MKPKAIAANRTSVGSGSKVGMTHYATSSQSPYDNLYDEIYPSFSNYTNMTTNMTMVDNTKLVYYYSVALRVTVFVGCTLLFFNVCIYFILYYQRAENRTVFSEKKRKVKNDKAHFWLNGYVNKQNCRIWSEANPQVYVETPLHPEKLTVWCALWAGGILLQKR
ncbi:hypothetical protein TNCV_702791 [Trichonephila clavipes]|nr:hypothetical protein TNCV_702791 [Trichonephila clavipes]